MSDAGGRMKDQLRQDLRSAHEQGNDFEIGVLRTLIAALDNAEAPPLDEEAARRHSTHRDQPSETVRLRLEEADVTRVLLLDVQEREAAAEVLESAGRAEHAEVLRRQSNLVKRYL
ncbi:hypothetical protein GC169_07315 [bacterium]|nr:hypothetical protein [bacterium]